jgi:hypothetical protein
MAPGRSHSGGECVNALGAPAARLAGGGREAAEVDERNWHEGTRTGQRSSSLSGSPQPTTVRCPAEAQVYRLRSTNLADHPPDGRSSYTDPAGQPSVRQIDDPCKPYRPEVLAHCADQLASAALDGGRLRASAMLLA